MKRIHNRLAILLIFALLLSLAAPVGAAGSRITHRTPEDLVELSRRCSLDSWSRGKTVVLSADLDLSDVEFSSIPTFGGTFDGQGYTISGLTITGSGNVRGLFRYLQSGGVVQNVSLEVTIEPTDLQDSLGGLVGTTAAVYETALSREVFRVKPILGESSASTNPVERSSTALFPAPSQENTMWAALRGKTWAAYCNVSIKGRSIPSQWRERPTWKIWIAGP